MKSSILYSVLVPVLDEAKNLPFLIEQIDSVLKNLGGAYEILILNDKGSDDSQDVLESLKIKYPHLKPVYRHADPGAGYALREGFSRAKGQIIITLDGDLSHDPRGIPVLLDGLKNADLVCGSCYVQGAKTEISFIKRPFSCNFNWLIEYLTGVPLKHATSNFRVFRREIIDTIVLNSTQFGIFLEIPIKAHFAGFRITERPIHYRQRGSGSSHSNLKQWMDYFRAVAEGIKMRHAK